MTDKADTQAPEGGGAADGKALTPTAHPEPLDRLVDAALERIALEGWSSLSLGAVARDAGLTLADAYREIRSKSDLLKAFSRRLDLTALDEAAEEGPGDEDEHPRDRLFDSVMRRFDAMAPYRDAIRVLNEDLRKDPMTVAGLMPSGKTALAWMLEAADIDTSGFRGAVRVRVLGLIVLQVLQTWIDDEAGDQAKTMADLDRRLRKRAGWLGIEERETGYQPGPAASAAE